MITYYALTELVGPDRVLAVNERLRTISLLGSQNDEAILIAEVQCSPFEYIVVRLLLQHYPHYTPEEVMLAHLTREHPSEEDIDKTREAINAARDNPKQLQELVHAMRNILVHARTKLKGVGLSPQHVAASGYMLVAAKRV